MENNKITTGSLVSYYRRKNNLQQKQLAYELDIAQSKISDWENDKASPSVDELLKLSTVLNVDPIKLIPTEKGIHFQNEFNENSVNQGQNVYYNNIEEERNAYKEALRAKDDALKAKDEMIAELRKK